MRNRYGLLLMLLGVGVLASARGEWRVESERRAEPLGHGAWEITKRLEGPATAELKLVFFDWKRCTLRVVDQDPRRGHRTLADALRKTDALAGTNGGYFTPDFQPLGLQIASGKRTGHMERAALLTGMVLVRKGRPYLLWRDEVEDLPGITDALQTGPRLVNAGRPVKGLENTKSRARTFLLTDHRGHLALGTCRNVTLAELADILISSKVIKELNVERALNLDGGHSTGLWWRETGDREHYDREVSTVRNFLAVMPQK